jgi:hypothetical protein
LSSGKRRITGNQNTRKKTVLVALCSKKLTWKISINKNVSELFPNVEDELELQAIAVVYILWFEKLLRNISLSKHTIENTSCKYTGSIVLIQCVW